MWFFSVISALLGLGVLDMMRHEHFWEGLLGAAYLFAGALYPYTRKVFPPRLALAGKIFSLLLITVSVPVIYVYVKPQAALVLGTAIILVSLVWWPEILPRRRKP